MNEEREIITRLGALRFCVEAKYADLSRAKIRIKETVPELPEGMQVQRSSLVLLTMPTSEPIEQLKFSCRIDDSFPKSGTCSGQGLDAWEWEDSGQLVVVGTEDGEWLQSRLKLDEINSKNYPVHYGENEISIEIDRYTVGKTFSLHFVVAENPYPELEDCSCWFAVDVPHASIINEFDKS